MELKSIISQKFTRLELAEERFRQFADRWIEIILSKEQRKKNEEKCTKPKGNVIHH